VPGEIGRSNMHPGRVAIRLPKREAHRFVAAVEYSTR
jgi:hypothetical protein